MASTGTSTSSVAAAAGGVVGVASSPSDCEGWMLVWNVRKVLSEVEGGEYLEMGR